MKNYNEALAAMNDGRLFEIAKKRALESLESGNQSGKFSACTECEDPKECATAGECSMKCDALGKAISEGQDGGDVLVQISKARAAELLGDYQRPDNASGEGTVAKSGGDALLDIAKARAAELTKSIRAGKLTAMEA